MILQDKQKKKKLAEIETGIKTRTKSSMENRSEGERERD